VTGCVRMWLIAQLLHARFEQRRARGSESSWRALNRRIPICIQK